METAHSPGLRYRREGYNPKRTLPEAFWLRIDRSAGPDACWPWLGQKTARGYGVFYWRGLLRYSHRVAYCLTGGIDPFTLPPTIEVRHGCDNPPCGNPAHLEGGSHADNMADKAARGRARNQVAGRPACAHGHPYVEGSYFLDERGHRVCRACKRAAWRRWDARQRARGVGR